MSKPANPDVYKIEKKVNDFYPTPEKLEAKIEEYFEYIEQNKKKRPTLAGMIYFLGYSNKKSVQDLKARKDPRFRHVIDRAWLRMEEVKNTAMLTPGQPTAAYIFDLKNNHGWVDRQEVTGKDGAPFVYKSPIDYGKPKDDKCENQK